MAYRTRTLIMCLNKCFSTNTNVNYISWSNNAKSILSHTQKSNKMLWALISKSTFHSSMITSSQDHFDNIRDDAEVRYFDAKHELQLMTFQELKQLATEQYNEKGRNLVKVKASSDKLKYENRTATFRTLSMKELEELVRKNKQHQRQQFFEVIEPQKYLTSEFELKTDDPLIGKPDTLAKSAGKIKYKQITINASIGDHDLQVAAKRIIKWLSNPNIIVTLNIKTKAKNEEGKEFVKKVKHHLGSDAENNSLIINS